MKYVNVLLFVAMTCGVILLLILTTAVGVLAYRDVARDHNNCKPTIFNHKEQRYGQPRVL